MRAFLVVALACALPCAAQAQDGPKTLSIVKLPDAPDPAALEQARLLVRATRVSETLDRMFLALAPVFAQGVIGALTDDPRGKHILAALQAKPGALERLKQLLASEYIDGIKTRAPALLEDSARQFASHFTADELRAINAFYASGPGAKLIALQPELQQTLAIAGKKLGEDAGREAGMRAFEKMSAEFGLDAADLRT